MLPRPMTPISKGFGACSDSCPSAVRKKEGGYGQSGSILDENCVRYAYGEKVEDDAQIMAAVESSLTDFFGADTAAEQNLKELFDR